MRKKKLAVKDLPRETMMSKSDKIRDLDERVFQRQLKSDVYFRTGYYKNLDKLKTARKEIRELKKKVDKLHSTIGFLLTQ
jgi:hypothetical protein